MVKQQLIYDGNESYYRTKALRDLMQRHGLSSRQVAALVGVHPVTVRRWMTGKARVPQSALMVLQARHSSGPARSTPPAPR